MKQRIQIKDSKFNSIEEYLVDIKLSEEQELIGNKIDNYISNNQNTDLVNAEFIKLNKDFELIAHNLSTEFGSETNRFFANIEKMKLW
ncbi:oligoendopeptidase F, partial [Mycoplasmopsis edwardii]